MIASVAVIIADTSNESKITELTALVHSLARRLGTCSHALGRVADQQPAANPRWAGEPNTWRISAH